MSLSLISVESDTLQTPKNRYYKLEGIRVIAEKPQESIGKIFSKKFPEALSISDLSIGESVEDINGISLSTGGKSGANLSIRGFGEKTIKILIDGRPISSGYFGDVDLNTIPMSEIKDIQILKGPVSALYGSDTMGGVVNIITRTPTNKNTVKLGALAKRNNTNKLWMSSSRSFENWDYWAYLSRYNTDGFMLSDDFQPTAFENGNIRNSNAVEQYDFQVKTNWNIMDMHSIGIQAGYTFMNTKEITSGIYESNYRQFTDWQHYQLSGISSLQLKDYLNLESNIYYDQYDDTYAEYSDPNYQNMYMTWPSNLVSWTFGIDEKLNWIINSKVKSTMGYRFEKQSYSRKDNGSYTDWTSNNILLNNVFIQTEFDLGDLNITGGLGTSFFKAKHRDNWIGHAEPSLGIFYTLPNTWIISLAGSFNTKYPSMHHLYGSTSGNLNLEEETAWKSEFTIESPFRINTIAGSITQQIYYNMINNLIDKVANTYQNFYEIESYGYEAVLKIHYFWDHQIDYSCVTYSDKSDYGLLEIPENTVNIKESIQLPWNAKFRYDATWKDERKTEMSSVILPPYWVHSLYLDRKWDRFKLMIGVENIFDANYQEEFGFPGEGLNFVISGELNL